MCLVLAPAVSAYGWHKVQHEAIVRIAYQRLSPGAQSQFRLALNEALDFSNIGSWADDIKKERPDSAPWHYIDLPLNAAHNAAALDLACPAGNCVLDALRQQLAKLASTKAGSLEKKEALLFVCHLAGDMSQPLHCAGDGDRGGNDKTVIMEGKSSNLHALWDAALNPRSRERADKLASRLLKNLPYDKARSWGQGSLEDWVWEAHEVAVQVVYPDYKSGQVAGEAYLKKRRALAEEQMLKAGVRLAALLEKAMSAK